MKSLAKRTHIFVEFGESYEVDYSKDPLMKVMSIHHVVPMKRNNTTDSLSFYAKKVFRKIKTIYKNDENAIVRLVNLNPQLTTYVFGLIARNNFEVRIELSENGK